MIKTSRMKMRRLIRKYIQLCMSICRRKILRKHFRFSKGKRQKRVYRQIIHTIRFQNVKFLLLSTMETIMNFSNLGIR